MSLSHRDKQRFFDSLSRLVHSGATLPAALDKLSGLADRSLRPVMQNLRRALSEGQTVSEAFASQGRVLGQMESSVIGAAERSGRLEYVLRQLGDYHEALAKAREVIRAKLAYPVFVFHFGILALSTPILVKEGLNPFLRATVGVFVVVYVAVFIFILLARSLVRTAAHQAQVDALLGCIPLVGRIRRGFAVDRFCLTYALHLAAGVNVMDALESAGEASQSGIFRAAVRRTLPDVRNGAKVGETMARERPLPAELNEAIIVGEESGQLDETLPRVANMFRNDALAALGALAEWLPRIVYLAVAGYMVYGILRVYSGIFDSYNKLLDFNASP